MEKKKPGRPTKYATRNKVVRVRLYEAEYDKIKEKADALGMSVSTFMMLNVRKTLYKS
jgi:predicted DNA binding CopG/RHH family protein